MLTGDLELPVDALQLVARAVHLGGEAADLVPIRNLEPAGEIAAGDLVEARLRPPQRRDD